MNSEKKYRSALVIDDDAIQNNVIRTMLELNGYAIVETAKDASVALQLFDEVAEPFDLVVTDWNMPNMDGLQFIEHLRESDRGAQTPVVLVTFFKEEELHKHPGHEAADAVLFKPINSARLEEAVRTAEHKRRAVIQGAG